jgi:hypothetical protein
MSGAAKAYPRAPSARNAHSRHRRCPSRPITGPVVPPTPYRHVRPAGRGDQRARWVTSGAGNGGIARRLAARRAASRTAAVAAQARPAWSACPRDARPRRTRRPRPETPPAQSSSPDVPSVADQTDQCFPCSSRSWSNDQTRTLRRIQRGRARTADPGTPGASSQLPTHSPPAPLAAPRHGGGLVACGTRRHADADPAWVHASVDAATEDLYILPPTYGDLVSRVQGLAARAEPAVAGAVDRGERLTARAGRGGDAWAPVRRRARRGGVHHRADGRDRGRADRRSSSPRGRRRPRRPAWKQSELAQEQWPAARGRGEVQHEPGVLGSVGGSVGWGRASCTPRLWALGRVNLSVQVLNCCIWR